MTTIAIIGAGVTGLTCARRLAEAGLRVTVFDKGRGLGGRLATRRVSGLGRSGAQVAAFDHGAQYVTARGADFTSSLERRAASQAAAAWRPRLSQSRVEAPDPAPWHVGTPGMSGLAKSWGADLSIALKTRVERIEPDGSGWRLQFDDGSAQGPYDTVVVTTPPSQALDLLPEGAGEPFSAIQDVRVAPCWAGLFAFDPQNGLAATAGFDCWRLEEGGSDDVLVWAAHNTSKPGRVGLEAWVVHAGIAWSVAHLEESPETVAPVLLEALGALTGCAAPKPAYQAAHRWRYARTIEPLGKPFLSDRAGSFYVGGDWCLGARVECGFDSGAAIAHAILWDAGLADRRAAG